MLKLLRNLKKTLGSVIAIVVLLCVQAATDLALPDFTSKIVNDGIQAGGITSSVPEVLSRDDMDTILIFTDQDEEILNSYTLVGAEPSDEQEDVINKYLGKDYEVESDTIYVLNELEENEKVNLEKVIAGPVIEATTITNEETASVLKEQILASVPDAQRVYLENMTLLEIIKQMPEEQRTQMLGEATKQVDNMSDSIKQQAAVSSVKEIYKGLGVDTDKIQNDYILLSGLQMLGVALISMISAVSIMFLSARVAARLGKTLRDKVFKKVLSYSTAELNQFSTASLITRSTNDIQQIQMLTVMCLRMVIYAPIMGIGAFMKVSGSSMAWVIGLAIAMIFTLVVVMFTFALPKFNLVQKLLDKINLVAREIITGTPVIRAFGNEKYEEKRFDKANMDLTKTNLFVNRIMSLMMPTMMFIMNGVSVLIIWVGSSKVDMGTMQVGSLVAFITYTIEIIMSFLMISIISIMIPRSFVSLKRVGANTTFTRSTTVSQNCGRQGASSMVWQLRNTEEMRRSQERCCKRIWYP